MLRRIDLRGQVLRARALRGVVPRAAFDVEHALDTVRPICEAVREVTQHGLRVTVSIPGGRTLAAKTFNPRLGIEGGLSILGTSGRVRPFTLQAAAAAGDEAAQFATIEIIADSKGLNMEDPLVK